MHSDDETVKERILKVTIELLRKEQNINGVSLRRIAREAGVAVSMVNYHYQTKANLVERAVQSFVGSVITGSSDDQTVDDMETHLSRAADFIVRHPGISRVSILRDMSEPHDGDNTCQVMDLVLRQMAKLFTDADGAADLDIHLRAAVQVATIQHLFLRSELFRKMTGLDFSDREQREHILKKVLTITTGRNTT